MVNLARPTAGTRRTDYVSWLQGQPWPEALLPGSHMLGINGAALTLPQCPLCGAVALDRSVHALWHADLAGLDT